MILLYKGILRLCEDSNQRRFIKFAKGCDNWQPSEEFRNQAKPDQIFRFKLFKKFAYFLSRLLVTFAPNPMVLLLILLSTTFSSPVNVPPQIKRMFEVSTFTKSC